MNAWEKLDEKIKAAKNQAKQTDNELEKLLLKRCEDCGDRMRPKGANELECVRCGKTILTNRAIIIRTLEENPGLTLMELSEITDISKAEIMAYLDDGFLELSSTSVGHLKCKICGIDIKYGTVCERCKNNYKNEFGKVNVREGKKIGEYVKPEESSNSKMHYISQDEKNRRSRYK